MQTQVENECFICHKSNQDSKGYGYRMENPDMSFDSEKAIRVCYGCCAKEDFANMLETGRFTGYLIMEVENVDSMPSERMAKEGWHGYLKPLRYSRSYKSLYAKNIRVANWPDSLSFKVYHMRIGKHNMANCRYDVWFEILNPNTKHLERWHGVTYGDQTQICHCKRTNRSVNFEERLNYLRNKAKDANLSYDDIAELKYYERFGFIPSEEIELLNAIKNGDKK